MEMSDDFGGENGLDSVQAKRTRKLGYSDASWRAGSFRVADTIAETSAWNAGKLSGSMERWSME